MKTFYTLLLLLLISPAIVIAQIKFVTENGGGNGNDGNSWETAYDKTKLQQAINEAEISGNQVWVAKGIYTPTENLTGTDNVDKSFILRNGVKIYGGFMGDGQDDLNTRDFSTNETILSGDFGGGVNAHHVIVNIGDISGVILDGFTISGGIANGSGNAIGTIARNRGGGMFLNSKIGIDFNNIIIKNNIANDLGGGVYLYYGGSATYNFNNMEFINNICDGENSGAGNAGALYIGKTGAITGTAYITACSFNNNQAFTGGGAIYNALSSTSTFNKCNFFGNKVISENAGAGAFYAYTGVVKLYNSVFYNNETNSSNIINIGSSTTKGKLIAINNTFYKNKTRTGYSVSYFNNATRAELNFYNNIFRDNRAYTDVNDFTSDDPLKFTLTDIDRRVGAIQDHKNNLLESVITSATGKTVEDNIDFSDPTNNEKPLFGANTTNPAVADFLNIVEGLATESGNTTLATTNDLLPGTDIAGNSRLQHTNIDLGAYEYQRVLPVVLDYFKVNRKNQSINLVWHTLAEHENDYFVIERGSSLANFKILTKIEAKANTSNIYLFTDKEPLQGVNYYRLLQYDFNGNHKIIGEKSINFALENNKIKISPIPANDYLTISLPEKIGKAEVCVFNMTGHKLISNKINKQEIILDISELKSGTYLLQIKYDNMSSDTKIFIKN